MCSKTTSKATYQFSVINSGFFKNTFTQNAPTIPVNLLLLSSVKNNSKILIDTGISNDLSKLQQLKYLEFHSQNFDISEITDVIITHAHFDHIGNLSKFKQARIHTNIDLDFYKNSYRLKDRKLNLIEYFDSINSQNICQIKTKHLETSEILDGIKVIEVNGHTSKMLCLLIDIAGDKKLFHASDLFPNEESLQLDISSVNTKVIAENIDNKLMNEEKEFFIKNKFLDADFLFLNHAALPICGLSS